MAAEAQKPGLYYTLRSIRYHSRMARNIRDTWGTTEDERTRPYPCDSVLASYDAACYRGVTVHAGAATRR